MLELLLIAFRSVVVYLFIIIAIKIFGKREITQLSIIDLVFILLISNSVQNAMVGSNSTLYGGLVAALSLFAVNALLQWLTYRSKKINDMVDGSAIMLIYKGKILQQHLKKAMISQNELEESVREHGVSDVKEVDLAVLEADGNISIISDNYQNRTRKKRKIHKSSILAQ